MRSSRFYAPGPYPHEAEFELPDAVFRHAVQVLRLRAGAQLQLFDGNGQAYLAELTEVGRRVARVRLLQALNSQVESPLTLTLMQGISRGERMDYAIQKAVELGVNHIIPVLTERCNVNLKQERADKRLAHWQGVVISACEQSGRNLLPILHDIIPFEAAVTACEDPCKLVLAPEATQRFTELPPQRQATLLIGPEGGLGETELEFALQQGFTGLRFGPRILRTETASVAALAIVQANWGDIG